jgi:hypothetical protein
MTNRQNKPHCAVVNNFRRIGWFHLLDVGCDTGVKSVNCSCLTKWKDVRRTVAVPDRHECGGMGNKQPPCSHLTWWQRRPPSTCANDAQAGSCECLPSQVEEAPPPGKTFELGNPDGVE